MHFDQLPAREGRSRHVHVVIDTPAGSRNKYKYDTRLGLFRISRMLPRGSVFPYDFGSIPQTRSPDGSPLRQLRDLDRDALRDIEHSFESYNRRQGRAFRISSRGDRRAAEAVLARALRAYRNAGGG